MESTSFHSTNILYIRIATGKIIQKHPFYRNLLASSYLETLLCVDTGQWQSLGNPALKLDVVLTGVTNAWISALHWTWNFIHVIDVENVKFSPTK